MAIEETIKLLQARENFRSATPATDAEIKTIEDQLGVKLPADYTAILRRFGCMGWFGQTIYGVHYKDPAKPSSYDYDALRQTRKARSQPAPDGNAIPQDAVVIAKYAGGGWYVLYSQTSQHAGQVALFDYEGGGQTWESLEEFLLWLIQ